MEIGSVWRMTKEMAKRWLPLIQALANGKELQVITLPDSTMKSQWSDLPPEGVNFAWCPDHYRVKPEPKDYWLVSRSLTAPWLVFYNEANAMNAKTDGAEVVHVREVIE